MDDIYKEIVQKTPYRGLRYDTMDKAARAEIAAIEAQMAKDNGWQGNWRNGPNPADYQGLITTWGWKPEDFNRQAHDVATYILSGDGVHQFRVPAGATAQHGTPLERMAKADDVLNTGDDAGIFNYIFGVMIYNQVTQQQTALAAIPKEGYARGGYRAKTAAAASSGMGTTQATTAKDAAHATFTEVSVGLKEHQLSVALSSRMFAMAGKDDVIEWDPVLQNAVTEFWTSMNADLLKDSNTTANLNAESLDRICGSYACIITGHTYSAGDDNLYGITRSSYSWMDANVVHNSDTDRAIKTDYLDSLIEGCAPYWTNDHGNASWDTKMFITGFDTLGDISRLESPKQRYSEGALTVRNLPGGLAQYPGQAGGFLMSTYQGIGIVPDSTVQADTSASRVYLVDTDSVRMSVGRPLDIVASDNRLITGLYSKANLYTIMETRATRFKSNGSIWDNA